MKAIILGDLHLDLYPSFGKNVDGVPNKLADIQKVLYDQVLNMCETTNYDAIIFTGDIFHSRSNIPSQCLDLFGDWLNDVASLEDAPTIYICQGNHDQFGENITALNILKRPGVEVFTKTSIISIADETVAFIPYIKDYALLREKIAKVAEKDVDVIVGHFGLGDVEIQRGFCESDAPFSDLLPDDVMIFIGHYHNHHQVTDRIWYIGSVHNTTFSGAGSTSYIAEYIDGVSKLHKSIATPLIDVEVHKPQDFKLLNQDAYMRVFYKRGIKLPSSAKIIRTIEIVEDDELNTVDFGDVAKAKSDMELLGAFIDKNQSKYRYPSHTLEFCNKILNGELT